MKDTEPERLERERQLQQKRESLQAIQFQLNATNNHKSQVENNVNILTNKNYQLRYRTILEITNRCRQGFHNLFAQGVF